MRCPKCGYEIFEMLEDCELILKFGFAFPSNNDICRICGKRYGVHYRATCSQEENIKGVKNE